MQLQIVHSYPPEKTWSLQPTTEQMRYMAKQENFTDAMRDVSDLDTSPDVTSRSRRLLAVESKPPTLSSRTRDNHVGLCFISHAKVAAGLRSLTK
ncbi:protein of unknown function [Streptomyces murinus]